MLRVCKIKDLQVIIHHFEEYSLITKKQADYLLFKMIVELMNRKEHLTKEGLNKIIAIKSSMNKGLMQATNELKVAFPNINTIVRPSVLDYKIKDSHWLAGFTEGESNFGIRITSSKSIETGKSVSLIFRITQHKRDILLMKKQIMNENRGKPDFHLPVATYENADIQKEQISVDNKRKAGIYRWINKVNGKSYVGSSTDLSRRFRHYFSLKSLKGSKGASYINRSLLKYGYSKFKLEILKYCSPEKCIKWEQYYFDLFNP